MKNVLITLLFLTAFSANAQQEEISFNTKKGRTLDFYSGLSLYNFQNLDKLLIDNGFSRLRGVVVPFGAYFSSWNNKISIENDLAVETNFSSASTWSNFYFSFLLGYDVLRNERWRVVPGVGGTFVGASVVAEKNTGQTTMSNLLQNANAVRLNARPLLLDLAISTYWLARPSEGGILRLKAGYRWDIGRPAEWRSNVIQFTDITSDNLGHFYFQIGVGFGKGKN